MSSDPVKLTVDNATCVGSGHCEMMEADVFSVDDDTAIARVSGEGKLPLDRAEVVIDRCPSGAISIADPAAESL